MNDTQMHPPHRRGSRLKKGENLIERLDVYDYEQPIVCLQAVQTDLAVSEPSWCCLKANQFVLFNSVRCS